MSPRCISDPTCACPTSPAGARERLHLAPTSQRIDDWHPIGRATMLSPTTASLDRTTQDATLRSGGVAHLWLIDRTRTPEVYRLDVDRWIVAGNHGGSHSVRAGLHCARDRYALDGRASSAVRSVGAAALALETSTAACS